MATSLIVVSISLFATAFAQEKPLMRREKNGEIDRHDHIVTMPEDGASLASVEVKEHQDEAKREAFRNSLSALDREEKKSMWWSLTEELERSGELGVTGETALRHTVDLWNQQVGAKMETEQVTKQRCAETGDGHFLRGMFSKVCATALVVDKFDPKADVKLDLSLPPAQAPEEIKQSFGTIDLLVSNQVFEHLLKPSTGISNLNALLKSGGSLVFSTPFVVPDHRSPKTDYFRYTVMAVDQLLQCAGFEVKELRGLGNRLESLAYLAGISSDMTGPSIMSSGCDGKATNDCANTIYAGVAAVAVKIADKTSEQVHDCFG